MTRCYEFYCMFACTPDKCDLSGLRSTQHVRRYMKFMRGYGVKFDKSEKDKALFLTLVDEHGTERALGRKANNCSLSSIPPVPRGTIYYADPPWQYDFCETDSRKIENQYPTMSVEEIMALPIPADENAVLYLWATAPKLREALMVMDAWGFEYKTHAIWDKVLLGAGYWFRGIHELLLVGTRGMFSPPAEKVRRPSVFREARTEHSRKPDSVYEMIEQQWPELEKVELFARHQRPGWTQWGNEIEVCNL